MKTTARKDGDHYILNGSKTFTSNAPFADLILIYAMTDAKRGALGGVSVFVVDRKTSGLSVGRSIEKMGLKSSAFAEVFLDDCRVPEDCLLGKPGMGFPILDYVMRWEILACFSVAIGGMQRRLDRCVAYARMRKQFGKPIGSYQAVSHKLVDMKIRLEVSRLWLRETARKMQDGANVSMDVAITKLLASEAAVASALDAIQVFGGYGYTTEYGLERDLRDAIGGTIYSGTSEIQRNRIASLMGV
jgi:alkylation response protein AidB-like acyl-CoA dehydrogenase